MRLRTITILISLLTQQPALAEKERQAEIDQDVRLGVLSHPLFGSIHGSGSVDFAKLNYEFKDSQEGTVTAAVSILPNKKEFVKLQQWQDQDTASSRARRDEYLASLGLGAIGTDGSYYACCTETALAAEACDLDWSNSWETMFEDKDSMLNLSITGNMILSPKVRFRVLDINATTVGSNGSDLGMHGVMWFGETRLMALFFGNCNTTASSSSSKVHIHGTVTWTSFLSASTLPLYIFLMLCHGGLCLWYRELMNKNKDARIQVEEWIFFTLFLAAVAVALKTIYYVGEAFADDEWTNLSFASEFSKSIARAVSRCLYLLLAMGVGITAPKLESARTTMLIGLFLGVYILCDFAEDLTIYGIFVPFFMQTFWIVLILSLIFMIWIPVAICKTMKLLEFRNETHKLERYRWILRIYFLAIGLGILQFLFFLIDMNLNAGRDYNFMTQDEQGDITYLIIITCMASLWKPHPSQQMYSYQLLGDDGDMMAPADMSLELPEGAFGETADDVNDLQLSATASL